MRSGKEIVRDDRELLTRGLYSADDGVAMSLSHDADLATVRARSWADVAFDHGSVALLNHHGTKLAALAG